MAAFPALFGLLMAAVLVSGQVEISPRTAVLRVGSNLTVMCRVGYKIESCRMNVGKAPLRLRPEDRDGDVIYAGRGLLSGECGAFIKHVREEYNGEIVCTLPPESGIHELTASMQLIVAKAPNNPVLIPATRAAFKEGEQIQLQCVSAHGRPAAKLTWFLDDEQILSGVHQPIIENEEGTDLQTIRQNLTRVLRAEDAGRRLACRAEHAALDRPGEASQQLDVQYIPRRSDGESGPITIFGLTLGEEGRLNVTVLSSPPPQLEWTVNGQTLLPNQNSDDGLATALPPQPLGGAVYNVSLVLHRVRKEDVERTYYLRVHNQLGAADLALRISTMDEPAGVELDTGAIVGIVVGVLVLLAAVFLVVFAKATDRWCFAGDKTRDHTKSSGESDTESAGAARVSRLGALGARVRAALPGRDKVRDTDQHQQDKTTEEKKGVVYAELALGEQPAADKPAPAHAEYAEIVYAGAERPDNKE